MSKTHHYKIIILFLLAQVLVKSQNLVFNGGFETYSACPTGTSTQSNMQINKATGWTQSTLTPDYFNACAGSSSNIYVPNSQHGYQKDCCGGEGYAGGYFLDANSTNNDDRDYIQTQLLDTLVAGHLYISSMFIARANFNYYITTSGMYFTDMPTTLPWPQGFIPASPQVKNTIPLSDTLNWIMVQDTFVATGSERYLTIGNFNTNATSDSVMSPGGFGTWWYFGVAYYYIDGVSVYDITSRACNNYWDAGFDKYIFADDSIRLGAINTDNSTYTWSNSAGGSTYLSNNADARPWSTPSVTTTYYVTKTCPDNSIFKDTVTVFVTDTNSAGVNQINRSVGEIKIFPNPSKGNFTLQYNLKEKSILEITDVTGNLVNTYSLPATHNNIEINNERLQNGVYIYRVINNGIVIKQGKIVVMK